MIDRRETAAFRDQQADAMPGPDPKIPCQGCDEEYKTSYFDQFGQISADPEEPCLCPQCLKEPTGVKSVEERREANQSITAFGSGSP